MKKVLIVGNKGNMGQRYTAILNHLGIEVIGWDKYCEFTIENHSLDGIIIATPTEVHLEHLNYYLRYNVPILCEKPFTTSLDLLDQFAEDHTEQDFKNITMVNQYNYIKMITDPFLSLDTHYNYFKTGSDGLAWDSLNIIGLAINEVKLEHNSPIWSCVLNGQRLSMADMDQAYVDMVIDWTSQPISNWDYAVEAHRRVDRAINQCTFKV